MSSSTTSVKSTRWCPTPEQVMILEEMFRSGNVRTPSASQIQQITAHLSFYGRVEAKNVFYWFQNHKARDRQKLRKKLAKLHHQHQHPSSSSSSTQQQPISNAAVLTQGVYQEDGSTKVRNYTWKTMDNPSMRMNGQDWMMMMMNMGPISCYQNQNRAIKTLELFPTITTTDLKENWKNTVHKPKPCYTSPHDQTPISAWLSL